MNPSALLLRTAVILASLGFLGAVEIELDTQPGRKIVLRSTGG